MGSASDDLVRERERKLVIDIVGTIVVCTLMVLGILTLIYWGMYGIFSLVMFLIDWFRQAGIAAW